MAAGVKQNRGTKESREYWEGMERLAVQCAASPADQWRLIETAPKDGTSALLLEPPELTGRLTYGHIVVGVWVPSRLMVNGGYWTDGVYAVAPTHWMPLPSPPRASEARPPSGLDISPQTC